MGKQTGSTNTSIRPSSSCSTDSNTSFKGFNEPTKLSMHHVVDTDMDVDMDTHSHHSSGSIKSKLHHFRDSVRKHWHDWAILMPAKIDLDDEYNFPYGRWAGQPPEASGWDC